MRFQEQRGPQCPFDGDTLVELPDPLIGRVIQERYLIEELIGSGGMGSVYRGNHQLLGRRVALKFLMPKFAQDVSSRTRFLREARAVNRVQHEHIIDVSDVGETEDSLVYMVMEHLTGRTLGDEISRGTMSLPRVCHIGRQLALALARAHELDVVHRDVKPGNVFLIQKGGDGDFVKLLDFGLARAKDDVTITKSNLLFGTPEYMAPEQASGASVGAKADLYAFGCVLFEMVTGRLPFEGAPTGLIYKHVYEQPPRPRSLREETPEDLDQLILRLLQKDPSRRPTSGYEVADELTRCAAQLPRISAKAPRAPSFEPPVDPAATERTHEEDQWEDNLQALRQRLAEESAGRPASEASQAVERAAALVSQTQALRREFGALNVSNAQRHDSDRATMMRIGNALDTLALDEARAASECETIKREQLEESERLEHEIRRLLAAVHTFDAAISRLSQDDLLRVARDWAKRQEQVLALREKYAEKEAAKADLRFQISHLKGRLASLEAASAADLEPVQQRAAELETEISKNLAEIRDHADRVTRHLRPQKASG
ncbi:MAG TPA: protein kinase [Polyangiales bacterium]|nr:protein kinase [Polyangiales bacterium]